MKLHQILFILTLSSSILLNTAEVAPDIKLNSLDEALTYKGEKIVYFGLGTYTSQAYKQQRVIHPFINVNVDDAFSQSYPLFLQNLIQQYSDKTKIILMDPDWKMNGYNKSQLSLILKKPLSNMYVVGERVTEKEVNKLKEYFLKVLSNGGILFIANYYDLQSLLMLFRSLEEQFPHQVRIFTIAKPYIIANNKLNYGNAVLFCKSSKLIHGIIWKQILANTELIDEYINLLNPSVSNENKKRKAQNLKLILEGNEEAKIKWVKDFFKWLPRNKDKIIDDVLNKKDNCSIFSLTKSDNVMLLDFKIEEEDGKLVIKDPIIPQWDFMDISAYIPIFRELGILKILDELAQ